MVRLTLGNIELNDFYLWAGDINQDQTINILDIVLIVNMILDDDLSSIRWESTH